MRIGIVSRAELFIKFCLHEQEFVGGVESVKVKVEECVQHAIYATMVVRADHASIDTSAFGKLTVPLSVVSSLLSVIIWIYD